MTFPLAELTVKTQQTPKPAAHEPLLEPPLEEHSLKSNIQSQSEKKMIFLLESWPYLDVKQVPFRYAVEPLLS